LRGLGGLGLLVFQPLDEVGDGVGDRRVEELAIGGAQLLTKDSRKCVLGTSTGRFF